MIGEEGRGSGKEKRGRRKMNNMCKKQSEGPGDEASFERMAQRKRGNIIMQRNPTVNTFTLPPRPASVFPRAPGFGQGKLDTRTSASVYAFSLAWLLIGL